MARRLIVLDTLRIVSILPYGSLLKLQGMKKVWEEMLAVELYSYGRHLAENSPDEAYLIAKDLAEIICPNMHERNLVANLCHDMAQSDLAGTLCPDKNEIFSPDRFHLVVRKMAEIVSPDMPLSNLAGNLLSHDMAESDFVRILCHDMPQGNLARNLYHEMAQSDLTGNPSPDDMADSNLAGDFSPKPNEHTASSSQSSKKYDVFISFGDEEIRNSFISHLHAALRQHQIETYIGNGLEKGDEVWGALVEAIQHSNLFLVVFSENYASSTWCLNELTQILECSNDEEHRVLPVFYKTDPSHVRKQMGSYRTAIEKHEQNNNHKQQVDKWRAALTQTANLSGWHCTPHRNEAELIREIIKCVLKMLDPIKKIEYEGLVGIQERIADVESCLCIGLQDVQFIGIWGIGGIGKTTLVTAVFNKLCFAYEKFCFLENVRQEAKNRGITYLKNKLLSMLLGDKEYCNGMPGGASPYIMSRLRQKKVLVILDDIDDPKQVENLAGAHSWFGPGSRIIITTRDKGVLGNKINKIYEVKALGLDESLQLFNLNAFQNNSVGQAFAHLSPKFVGYAKGIPLTLKVLGSFLYNKSEEEWNDQLKKLQKMSFATIYNALELSYNGLDPEEKDIFLDIACFFNGGKVDDIKMVLDGCGYSTAIGLRSLQDKALLIIFEEKIFMHDLIQEIGWRIVHQESLKELRKQSRLWNATDIYQVLEDYSKGSKAIRGITLDMSNIEELKLSPQVFAKMSKLKFLEFYDSKSNGHTLYLPQGLESLSNELRYFRWDNYPSKSLPLTFSAENLVKLEMRNSKISKIWNGIQNVVNLKVIDLSNSKDLMELPNFSKALHLEEVYLSNCKSLYKVHSSILSLDKLKVLELYGCASLTCLTSDIHLRFLPRLCLSGCFRLKEFSITSENMTNLDLQGTAIRELPSSIGRMCKLKDLKLSRCRNLKNLPSNLFDGLRSLEKLWLDHCDDIFEIPDNICRLSSLSFLSIKGTAVGRLPTSIKHLSSLKSLCIDNCRRLRCLPGLPSSIQELKACNCSSLEIVQFTSLKAKMTCAQFQNCVKLDEYSLKTILANVLVHRTKVPSELQTYNDIESKADFEVIYPGHRVPEWFKYRTTHASMTIDLFSAPHSTDWGLIFCFVLGQTDPLAYGRAFISDHVYLYDDAKICSRIHDRIKRRRATSNSQILLEMGYGCDILEIKQWGICLTYASEYQDFIKRMASNLQATASEIGVGRIDDKEETLPPNQELVDSIFRSPFKASQPNEFFKYFIFFFCLLVILFRLNLVIRNFWGQTSS